MMSCIVGLKPSRILVCGGRHYDDRLKLFNTMNNFQRHFAKHFCIIQGGATGADRLARQWAETYGYPLIEMPAHWLIHDKKAGPLRNRWMLDFCNPQIVIAFPGGSGTAHMVSLAAEYRIPVEKI